MKYKSKHIALLRDYDIDKSDPWGSLMSVFFDLCEYMEYNGMQHNPEWQYKPGVCALHLPDSDSFSPMEYTEEECRELGVFLHRVTNHYHRLGGAY